MFSITELNGGDRVLGEAAQKQLLLSPMERWVSSTAASEGPGVCLCRHCAAHTTKPQKPQVLPLFILCWWRWNLV